MSDFDDIEMTTEGIEHEILWSKIDEAKPGYRKAFHRWLQSVKAEAWYEGQDSCGDQFPWAENPYETEETV